jgi:hypothetical protein
MILIAYFRLSQIKQGLIKNGIESETQAIGKLLEKMPYGKIHKYFNENE